MADTFRDALLENVEQLAGAPLESGAATVALGVGFIVILILGKLLVGSLCSSKRGFIPISIGFCIMIVLALSGATAAEMLVGESASPAAKIPAMLGGAAVLCLIFLLIFGKLIMGAGIFLGPVAVAITLAAGLISTYFIDNAIDFIETSEEGYKERERQTEEEIDQTKGK